MKRSKLIIIFLTSLVILCCVVLYYNQTDLLEGFEAKTYDLRFKTLRGALEPNRDIVIVAIDEKSVGELGRFPWSRTYFAEFVDRATSAGAKAIFMDAFFPEPENPAADAAFAAALRHSGIASLAVAFEFAADGSIKGMTQSLPELQQASGSTFHINMTPDSDGVVRWTPLLLRDGEQLVSSLGLGAARAMLGGGQISPGTYEVRVGDRVIPTDADYFSLISYVGPPGIYPRISFSDVVKGRVGAKELQGKLLLVGSTALGIYDMRVTPFSNNSPGVEVHANIIDSILAGRQLRHGGPEALIDLIAIVSLGILAAFITLSLRHAISLPLILLLLAGHTGVAYAMFHQGQWISLVYPELSIILAFSTTAYLRFFFLDRKTREIRNIFSSYVSKKVVDRLVKDPSQAKVGGESRQVTILFSDVQNYTGFSEKLPPHEVVRILNQYLAEMTHLIMAQEGTLDKFIGDGIMTFWGAPVEQPGQAELAVDCALQMITKMEELGSLWQSTGQEPLAMRIGINSGEVVVGNIGAEGKKMEYTVIGDNVNLASRLESINKLYGTRLLISGTTKALLPEGKYLLREIDLVRVKGKATALPIFEVMESLPELADGFAAALTIYRQGRFAEAAKLFSNLLQQFDDQPSRLYLKRSQDFLATPPPPDWDGSFTALRK